MVEIEATVGPAEGFTSEIVVVKDGREANATSSPKIMTLGAKRGGGITEFISAEG